MSDFTPQSFWKLYREAVRSRCTLSSVATDRGWTETVAITAAEEACSKLGLQSKERLLRLDVAGYQPRRPGEWYDYDLRVAFEHENHPETWADELCKLCHIVADLRVLVAYWNHTLGQQREEDPMAKRRRNKSALIREEIAKSPTATAAQIVEALAAKKVKVAKTYMERVDVAFDGFNNDPRELWEIDPVREFVRKLDEHFPFWLFFLSKAHGGLRAIVYCFLPPFLTPEAQEEILPQRMKAMMDGRWFPAMNHVSEYAGLSEDEIFQLTSRVFQYFTGGPL